MNPHLKTFILDIAFLAVSLLLLLVAIGYGMRIVHARELRQFEDAAHTARGVHQGGIHHWDLVRAYNQRTRETWLGRRIVPAGWDEVEAIGGETYRPAFTTATGRVIQ